MAAIAELLFQNQNHGTLANVRLELVELSHVAAVEDDQPMPVDDADAELLICTVPTSEVSIVTTHNSAPPAFNAAGCTAVNTIHDECAVRLSPQKADEPLQVCRLLCCSHNPISVAER